jgi:hypothetical protein
MAAVGHWPPGRPESRPMKCLAKDQLWPLGVEARIFLHSEGGHGKIVDTCDQLDGYHEQRRHEQQQRRHFVLQMKLAAASRDGYAFLIEGVYLIVEDLEGWKEERRE